MLPAHCLLEHVPQLGDQRRATVVGTTMAPVSLYAIGFIRHDGSSARVRMLPVELSEAVWGLDC
jgi:hypothetical protein